MRLNNGIFIVTACLALAACGTKPDNAAVTGAMDETSTSTLESSPAVCIWKEVGIRETPAEKGKYITSIYLGEKLTALGDTASEVSGNRRYQYVKVKLVDETEGWVRTDFVAKDAVPAGIVYEATIYRRPDMMTATDKAFHQLDFVALKGDAQDGWAEVIGKRAGDTWFSSGYIKADAVTIAMEDVALCVFFSKAMDIQDNAKRAEEFEKLAGNPDLRQSSLYSTLLNRIAEEGGEGDESDPDSEE